MSKDIEYIIDDTPHYMDYLDMPKEKRRAEISRLEKEHEKSEQKELKRSEEDYAADDRLIIPDRIKRMSKEDLQLEIEKLEKELFEKRKHNSH